jgi:hypothetical protein
MRKQNSGNRVKWIHLRLSLAEHKEIMKKRTSSTCRSLSHYIRNVILDRPIITTYRNLSQDEILVQMALLNSELNALGNNLNQITKKLHTLRDPEHELWGLQFTTQADSILVKLVEVKNILQSITRRWLQ